MAETLKFVIEVDDKGSATIKQFGVNVQETTNKISKMGSALETIKISAFINIVQQAANALKGFIQFLDIGAKAKQTEESFNMITKASGIMGSKLIEDIKKASGVFVDSTDVMIKAQRALNEGIAATDIVKLTEASRMAARMMGVDVKQAFEGVMEAVITLRTRGIKAAFPMDDQKVIEDFAKSIGATSDELTEYGKRQAIINEIVRQYNEIVAKTGPLQENYSESIQKTKSAMDEFEESVSKGIGWVAEKVKKGMEWYLFQWAYSLNVEIPNALDTLKKKADDVYQYLQKLSPWGAKKEPAEKVGEGATEIAEKTAAKTVNWVAKTSDARQYVEVLGKVAENTKKLVDPVKQLENVYKQLGITSQKVLSEIVEKTQSSIEKLKKAGAPAQEITQGYAKLYQDLMKLKPKDLQEELSKSQKTVQDKEFEAIEKRDKAIKELRQKDIAGQVEDYTKAFNQIEEEFNKTMSDIFAEKEEKEKKIRLELDQDYIKQQIQQITESDWFKNLPIKPKMDIDLTKATQSYNEWKSGIEAEKIHVTMEIKKKYVGGGGEAAGGEGGGGEGAASFQHGGLVTKPTLAMLGEVGPELVIPINKVMAGLSRSVITEIIRQFGGLEGASVLDTMASIERGFNELIDVKREKSAMAAFPQFWTSAGFGGGAFVSAFTSKMEDLDTEMKATEYSLSADVLRLATTYKDIIASYQYGTNYVPKTGVYRLHEGERVTPKNVNNFGGITVNVPKGTSKQQAMEVIRQLQKSLKYRQVELS